MASYRNLFLDLYDLPLGGGAIAYSVLTAPRVYLEFEDRLTWRFVNYLWEVSDPVYLSAADDPEQGGARS